MALFEIKMPKLGESITEGTILSWSVKVGDNVQEDDVLFEVSTAKVSAEIPSPLAGQVHDIFFAEGDTVAVGTVVATIRPQDDEEDTTAAGREPETESPQAKTDHRPAETERRQPQSDTPAQAASAPATAATAGSSTQMSAPASPHASAPDTSGRSSESPAAGNASAETSQESAGRWYSPVVLQLAREAHLPQAELDRIPGTGFEGRLSKKDIQNYIRQKQNGAAAPMAGSPADAHTGKPSPASQAAQAPQPAPTTQSAPTPPSAQPNQAAPDSLPEPGTPAAAPKPSPSAASPKNGSPKSSAAASSGDTRIEMDRVRRMIADHMVMSKQVSPHVTNVIEIDVSRLVQWRTRTKDTFLAREGIKLTYMPAIAEATARALTEYPQLNASVDGYSVILRKHINLGIAVSLADGNLIVPVIPDADKLNLTGLAAAIDTLAAKARDNKLSPADIQGGTFTITNFGTFKSLFGTPIINQPEVAILAVGYIEKKPAVVETPEGDTLAIRHKMYLSLSYDHRIIDGALGGAFLRRIGDLLENWNA